MKFSQPDIDQIRSAMNLCRVAGIDAVVVTNNQISGIAPSSKLAVISKIETSFVSSIKLGIGRIGELEKRLQIFGADPVEIEGKVSENQNVSVLTISQGRSKVQFRCTAEKLIKYPKSNDDPEIAVITITKAELQQLSRAVKTLSAETITLAIGRDSRVRFECSSATNEAFSADVVAEASFQDDPQAIVHTYSGDRLATVFDTAARDADEAQIVLGESGTLSIVIKNHLLIVLPEANSEEDDYE